MSYSLFHIAYDNSCADWDYFHDHLRVAPWEDIFKLSTSAASSEFCEWVQVWIDVYIPHRKYQVKSQSSPWFLAACAAVIVHRNLFFVCTNRIDNLTLKESSGKLVIVAEGFFKLASLHMLIKQKSPSLPRNLAHRTIGELLIMFSTKVNLLYLLYSVARRCCLLHLLKQNCFQKTFLKFIILMT